jgi:hypothetical protein
MSLVPYRVTAIKKTDPTGNNVLPFASVSIIKNSGGFAQLWDDEVGTISRSNPFTVDSNGERQVWLSGGSYSVTVSGGQSWDIKLTGGSDILSIDNVAALSSITAVADRLYELKEYNDGTGVGGGQLVGALSGVVDDGTIFAGAGGTRFIRINYSQVSPEIFGSGLTSSPSDDTPTRAALLHALPCELSRVYQVTSAVVPPAGKVIRGLNKQLTGLIAASGFSIPGLASSVLEVVSDCRYENFRVDANNQNGGGGKRLNCCPVGPAAKNFHVSGVDVYNATGYGHVTFGSESDPEVTGYYENCHGYNCQVPFEQIGALDVTLVKCTAEGVAGRTLEIFHPYAGSKSVTYSSCRGWGVAGAGVNILTTNGHPVGPIRFINSSIDITGTTSAINVERVSGADTTVDLEIIGGSYRTTLGSPLNVTTAGNFKLLAGAKLIGGEAVNGAAFSTCKMEFNGADIFNSKNSNTQQAIALVTNSAAVKIVGGTVSAVNSGTGGAQTILGIVQVSNETTLIPASTSSRASYVASAAAVTALQADGDNSLLTITLPASAPSADKVILNCSIVSPTDVVLVDHSISWAYIDSANIRVRVRGINSTSNKLSYFVGVLP